MKRTVAVGAVLIVGALAAGGGYAYKTYLDEEEAERADRMMRADAVCEGMKESIVKFGASVFAWAPDDIGGEFDTPENWKEHETIQKTMARDLGPGRGYSADVIEVIEAMTPYNRDISRASTNVSSRDRTLWEIGREVCLQVEMKR